MNSPKPLIRPEECALLLIDQQAGLAFGVGSIDRQVLLNNAIALASRTPSIARNRLVTLCLLKAMLLCAFD